MPSSVIRDYSYDAASRTLSITFQSGRAYQYLDVPGETFEGLREAFAKGEYFNQHIRSQFVAAPVSERRA